MFSIAGVRAEPARDGPAFDGTVLWEEFVEIHRRIAEKENANTDVE